MCLCVCTSVSVEQVWSSIYTYAQACMCILLYKGTKVQMAWNSATQVQLHSNKAAALHSNYCTYLLPIITMELLPILCTHTWQQALHSRSNWSIGCSHEQSLCLQDCGVMTPMDCHIRNANIHPVGLVVGVHQLLQQQLSCVLRLGSTPKRRYACMAHD